MEKEKLLEIRKQIKKRKPDFSRKDSHKKKRLACKWVRPRGLHNKLRLRKRGHKKPVSKGYSSPKTVKGLDRTGFETIIVKNRKLDDIDPKTQGMVISSSIGLKKMVEIVKGANSKGIKILNIKDADSFVKKSEDVIKKRKEKREKRKKKKEEKEKKRKAEEEKKEKKEGKGIEKAISEEERKEQEKEKKGKEKKEMDKVLTKKT